ncbi:MAG: DUF433 domain-containing protein [Dehalococcoidia bacterium]
MAALQTNVYSHIVRDASILDGEPVVKGTRVPVRSIAILCRLYHTMDTIRAAYPMLSEDAINEALMFYGTHWQEIEQYIAENEDDDHE